MQKRPRREEPRLVSWEEFAEAQERLHQALRKSGKLPPEFDVPLEVAPTEWSRQIESMVTDVLNATGRVVIVRTKSQRLPAGQERVG